jgi:tetratricopeptide (TPR) repeat protein
MKKLGYAGLSTVLCLVSTLPVFGQAAAAAPGAACDAKARTYYATPADMKLFDDFVNDATCKDSMYRDSSFQLMAKALIDGMKWKEEMALANRYTTEIPAAAKVDKGYYICSQALTAASQLADGTNMIGFGEKVLAVKSDDLNAKLVVATTIPLSTLPADAAAKDKLLSRAAELATQLIATPKPDAVKDDSVWQLQVVGPSHAVIGFVELQKPQYPEAEAEFEKAVKINPKDQLSWYRYGVAATQVMIAAQKLIQPAYDEVNNNRTPGPERDAAVAKRDAIEKDATDKRDKAVETLTSAVALPNPDIAKAARTTLEQLWKPAHNDTLDGLDDAIAARKTELSK